MLVLGLDTALQRCSLAILKDGAPIAVKIEDMERGHAEHVAPMAQAVFSEAGATPRDLDRIGVVVGPGGFTGVRIALSFARALGVATGVPVVGVTSLEALAQNVKDENGLIAPMIDARRGQVYAGLYAGGKEIVAPFVDAPEAALARLKARAGEQPALLVGTGAGLVAGPPNWTATNADPQLDPVAVARIAIARPHPVGPPAPLYLRAPDAKKPAARQETPR
jgi:tRNA threonylcarbamoyladenosine biosynthesis protein TsaB